jgi:molybdate/tungstate transport system permease protein
LARRSIFTGTLMMWARGISEFGAVIILTYFPMVASILIYQRFESYGLTQAIPVAAILVVVCALIFIGFRYILQREKKRD